MRQATILATLLAASLAGIAGAATPFTDRAAWLNALGDRPTTVIDFNGIPEGTELSTQFAAQGITFEPHGGRLPLIFPGFPGMLNPPAVMGHTHIFSFDPPAFAVGWDRISNDLADYEIFDTSGNLIAHLDLDMFLDSSGPFGGFISDVPIGRATSFSPNDDQRHAIDNIEFTTVPEPATVWLCVIGLCAIWMLRRHRQRVLS